MRKIIKLASVLLKCSLGTGTAEKQKKTGGKSIANAVLLVGTLIIMYGMFRGGMVLGFLFGGVDEDGLMIGLLLLLVSSFIFCTGIATCVNSFYLSSNLDTLLVMPFTSSQITGAKFIVAAVYEYAISLTVLAPVLAGYGYAMGGSVSFWIGAALAVILLPIVPLAYAAVVSMVAMRFIGGVKNKERITALGAIGAFVVLILYQIIQQATKGMTVNSLEEAVTHLSRTLNGMTGMFPNLPFLVRIMEKGDLLSILWCCLVVAGILFVFLFTAKHLYLAGAVGLQNTSASHKKITEKQMERENRSTGIVWSYTRKELRTILRTPAYYTSCLFLTLGWPLLLILPMLFSQAEQQEAENLGKILFDSGFSVYSVFALFCVVFAVTLFAVTLNGIAPFAISREGKSFFLIKQLPVPYRKQLKAKQNAALLICAIGSGGYLVIGEGILILLRRIPCWVIIPSIVMNVLLLYIIVDLELLYGLMKPKLVWESEGEMASKNRIGFVFFLVGIVIVCVMVYGFGDWVKTLTCGPLAFMAILYVILAVTAFLVNRSFYLYGEKKLDRL